MTDYSFSKQKTLPILTESSLPNNSCPKKIGPYNIKRLFIKGGMSILYLGTHNKSGKTLIIKVLPPHLSKDKDVIKRFLKEAEIINIFNHPNIIKLYGQGQWEHGLYIATEFIKGISLREFIKNNKVSTRKALEIILQISYALCHLHYHKIIHRDLKPENIMITKDREIKVIDFGIAQLKDDSTIENSNKIIGTPIYMSPEQKENPSNLTMQTDIYSLGIITYELLTRKSSKGSINLELLPKNLKGIIIKSLEYDLNKRFKTIVEFTTNISESIKKITDKGL